MKPKSLYAIIFGILMWCDSSSTKKGGAMNGDAEVRVGQDPATFLWHAELVLPNGDTVRRPGCKTMEDAVSDAREKLANALRNHGKGKEWNF